MKETRQIIDFECDECSKKIKDCTDFPYEEGWCYLYNFTFKLAKNKVPMPKDKHFCSKDCLTKFVNKILERSMTCLFG